MRPEDIKVLVAVTFLSVSIAVAITLATAYLTSTP